MFAQTLFHSMTELPKLSGAMTITDFLPKDVNVDPDASQNLMHPLAVGHILQPAEMKLSFSSLPAFCLLYATKGNGKFTIGETTVGLTGGSLLFTDLSRPFGIYSERALEYDIIYFTGAQASYFFTHLCPDAALFFIESLSKTGLLPALRPVLPSELETGFSALTFHRRLTDFLTEACEAFSIAHEHSSALDDTLALIKEYIDNNYYQPISLEDLETQFFINRFRLCKEFSEKYYISPIQYMHTTRINKAKDLLRQTSLKVHEISYQVGYESSTQFINHFKKVTGRTPQEYRTQ